MSILVATIDANEPKWAKELKFDGAMTNVAPLDAGDYKLICSDGMIVLIERKTPGDLLNTIKEGRLFPQVEKLLNEPGIVWPYLLITGELKSDKNQKVIVPGHGVTGWNINAIWGVLSDVQEMGVTVTFCQSDSYLKEALVRLSKRDRSKKKIEPRREFEGCEDWEKVLLAFPGMGPTTLQKFKDALGEDDPFKILIAMFDDEVGGKIAGAKIGHWRYVFRMWADTNFGLLQGDTPFILQVEDKK